MHVEFLLEEPSSEAFFAEFLPRISSPDVTWQLNAFQGKADLLTNLESRLKGYSRWIPNDWRIVVLVDEDRENCKQLKAKLENAAKKAGLVTKTSSKGRSFTVLNRIAVEELEAWFFGDVPTLCSAYPGVPSSLDRQEKYRSPDSIAGGTWESIERVLQRAGHFPGGLGKIELARTMGKHIQPERNKSNSFQCLLAGLQKLGMTGPAGL